MIGVDDAFAAPSPMSSDAAPSAVSASPSAIRSRPASRRRTASYRGGGRRRARARRASPASARCAARITGRTPPPPTRSPARRPVACDDRRRASRASPAWPTAWSRWRGIGRVLFVNDSKATNADAAAQALSSFSDIYWIAGGKPKAGGIDGLEPLLPEHRQGLSDRRGGRRLRRQLGGAGRPRHMRHARSRGRSRRRRCEPVAAQGAGGAAVAGLRLLRPVPQFRSARRQLPRSSSCASTACKPVRPEQGRAA